MRKILITGSTGFIGKNLVEYLKKEKNYELLISTRTMDEKTLRTLLVQADSIIHLAGVSRPKDPQEFYTGNSDLTAKILTLLYEEKKSIPIVYTSSTHASMDNDFGTSKRLAENLLKKYSDETGSPVFILRLTNTFGKYAKPNAHSVIATFCYNTLQNIPLEISDTNKEMNLAYVEDVIQTVTHLIENSPDNLSSKDADGIYRMEKIYTKTLGDIADTITHFKGKEPVNPDEFTHRLYNTYISYKEKISTEEKEIS